MDDRAGDRPLSEPRSPAFPEGLAASIVLLRHGESMAIVEGRFQGRLETPLSPLGRRQAELAGARLARPADPPRIPVPARPPAAIVHSPLERAAATASAAADALRDVHGAAVPGLRPEPDLLEIGQGAWEGLHRDEVVAHYPAELEAWRVRPAEANAPEGESLRAADRRVRRALENVVTALVTAVPGEGPDRTSVGGYPAGHGSDTPWALLVAHDGIFKVALLALLDLPLERFWTFPWALTGISVVELVAGRAVLRAHNLTDHLGPLQGRATEPGTVAAEVRSEDEAASRERAGSL